MDFRAKRDLCAERIIRRLFNMPSARDYYRAASLSRLRNNHRMYHNKNMRRIRSGWMLSQGELAQLLGITQTRVSRYEKGEENPSLPMALGIQVIFGCSPRSCFAKIYAAVEEAVMTRAAAMETALAGKRDAVTAKRRQLLRAMMERATRHNPT